MLWKKLTKISALSTVALSVLYLIWTTINKWLVAGNADYYASELDDIYIVSGEVIYGSVNYVFLSIISLLLSISAIALIVSATFMIIDIYNRTHGINEPSFLSNMANRPRNTYNQPQYNNPQAPYGQPPVNQQYNQPPQQFNRPQ